MRTIAIVNQKGGCGKTTTAVNLAGSLVADGFLVLVIDLDPQAHATLALGIDPEGLEQDLYEVLADEEGAARIGEIALEISEGLELVPSSIILSALEQKLAAERAEARTERLANALAQLPREYDFVIIDCPPNVGLLTFNALRAASEVLVPLEMSGFAIHGVEKLIETISLLSERIRNDVTVRLLPTLYDGRTRYAREILAEIRERYKDLCYDTVIRSNVKLRESSRRGIPIGRYAPSANGALDYASLALEVAASAPAEASAEAPAEALAEASAEALAEPLPRASAEAEEREVVIRFRDDAASDVRIAGDFNGWIPDKGVESRVEAEGVTRVWTKVLHLPPGTYQYRYVVDGEWREDPENPRVARGPVGEQNSLLIVR